MEIMPVSKPRVLMDKSAPRFYPTSPTSPTSNHGERRVGGGLFSGTMYDSKGRAHRFESDCVVSTAACKTLGLPNDCVELNTLRRFRDEYIRNLHGGGLLVKIYYKVGSRVVRLIDRKPDRKRIYTDLYCRLVRRNIELIAQGKKSQALLRGVAIVAWLYLTSYFSRRRG